MKVGDTGEAFFVFETDQDVPDHLQTSPLQHAVGDEDISALSNEVSIFATFETKSVLICYIVSRISWNWEIPLQRWITKIALTLIQLYRLTKTMQRRQIARRIPPRICLSRRS